MDLPTLADAEGELRTAMVQSFVAFLLGQALARASSCEMLRTAQPGRVDAAAQEVYGRGLAALEESWAKSLEGERPKVKLREFLGLTIRYLRPHVRRELEIFVYMLFGLAFTTVFPFAMRRLLDSAIPHRNFGQVVQILGVLGIAFVVSLLAGLRRAYLSAFVSSSVTRDLRVDMFTRLQSLSAGWFGSQQQGDVLSRLFSDVGQLERRDLGDDPGRHLPGAVRRRCRRSCSSRSTRSSRVIVIVGAPLVAHRVPRHVDRRAETQPRRAGGARERVQESLPRTTARKPS